MTHFISHYPQLKMTTKRTSPAHPQAKRIERAIDALIEVSDHWDEDEVSTYPPDLPSFDEFIETLSTSLLSIEWKEAAKKAICTTCGSEIVATINNSNFRDGECGPCEYNRYTSQAALLSACKAMVIGIPDELM